MLRMYKWRLWEFSTKKYVLFTTYFMSSFQITWYFQHTLWPRFDSEQQPYIWVPFYRRVFIYSYSTTNIQLISKVLEYPGIDTQDTDSDHDSELTCGPRGKNLTLRSDAVAKRCRIATVALNTQYCDTAVHDETGDLNSRRAT